MWTACAPTRTSGQARASSSSARTSRRPSICNTCKPPCSASVPRGDRGCHAPARYPLAGDGMRLLEGYVALDLTDLRGQLCGRLLRDLGMTVVKIEPPGGDPVRQLGPFAHDRPDPEGSLRFAYLNAGKQSVVLDLAQASGRDALLRL